MAKGYQGNKERLEEISSCKNLFTFRDVGGQRHTNTNRNDTAGLKISLHSYGTNIEGEWDDVFAAIKCCHEKVHAMGAPRITTTIKLGTRTDRDQSMEDKIDSVKSKLAACS